LLIVIPYPLFNYLLPIIEKGGPGIWFLFGYLIYIIAGPVGFGTVSALIKTIEIDEKAHINEALAKIGFYLSYAGVLLSSILLALAGALGGLLHVFRSRFAVYLIINPFSIYNSNNSHYCCCCAWIPDDSAFDDVCKA